MKHRPATRQGHGPNRLPSWVRKSLTAVGLVVVVSGAGVVSAAAQPIEMDRAEFQGSVTFDNYCGDLQVRIDYQDRIVVVARETGPDQLPRYTVTHHGSSTVTNLATGKAFSITQNYVAQDVRVTDNGDGTLTILYQLPGPERWYGPDGEGPFLNGGTLRWEAVVDHAGTPGDPSDDTFIGEEFVSLAGRGHQDFDYCTAYRTLTG